MIITFKTLQQKTFKIEIDETEKVKVLKEKIEAEKGSSEFPVDGQKLIYAGKILDDDKSISEYNIDAVKNFVVVMAVKPKAKTAEKPKDATEGNSSSTSTTPAAAAAPAEATTTTTHATEIPSTASASETTAEANTTASSTNISTSSASASSVEAAESALLTGSALETSVTELMSLGYSREQVMRALNSSFHNADRAAEYLLSGNIPDIAGEDVPLGEGEEGGAPPPVVTPTETAAPASGGGDHDISFLASLPQFQLMRNQVRQNPAALPQLLQEIGQSNPQLLQLISQNQQRFIDLLNSPDDGASEQQGGGGGGSGGGDEAGGFQIQVTQEEKAAIDRIVGMGFPEPEVIQAFFACEKNEQLTINFLLSQ